MRIENVNVNKPNVTIEKEETKEQQVRRIAYARVSTRDQLDGFGIDVQISKIKDYLQLYDYTGSFIQYVDEGISAKNLDRPEMMKLIEDIKNDRVDEVIIYKLDRISRNVSDIYYLINLMLEHNCNLVSVMDHLDIRTANGRMIVGILAVISQWERETDSERTIDSTIEMLETGLYPFGRAVFGCKIVDHKLVPDEKEQAAYQFIIDRACDGKTLTEISKELRSEFGINKRDDKIRELLERDYYATGYYTYNGIQYANIIPILTTMEKLKLARKIFRKRTTILKNDKYHYYNKVRTAEGDVCICKPTKKRTHYVYYYEYNNKRINQNILDEQVIFRTILYANEKNKSKSNKAIRKKALKIEKKIEKVYEDYKNDKIDQKVYGYTLRELHKDLEHIRLKEYVNQEDEMTIEKWYNLTDQEKTTYIDEHISSIVVDLDLKIVLNIKFR